MKGHCATVTVCGREHLLSPTLRADKRDQRYVVHRCKIKVVEEAEPHTDDSNKMKVEIFIYF
jgi:hypothetical protein